MGVRGRRVTMETSKPSDFFLEIYFLCTFVFYLHICLCEVARPLRTGVVDR